MTSQPPVVARLLGLSVCAVSLLGLFGCAHGNGGGPGAAANSSTTAKTPAVVESTPNNPNNAPSGGDELDRLLAPRAMHDPSATPAPPPQPAVPSPTPPTPVTVRGEALDAVMGAVVRDDAGKVWYVAKLSAWPNELRGKRVEVRGLATSRQLAPEPQRDPTGAVSHGMVGRSDVIEAATWRPLP